MMTLDDLSCNIQTLNTVGVDGSLGKPLGIGDLLGLGIEHFHEITTDNLAFLLGITYTGEIGKELL